MGDVTRYPWEKLPPAVPVEKTLEALQRDVAFMVTHTAVNVHSDRRAFQMLVNTPRGQIIPRGECTLSDGTTFELQDIGMPQPGAPQMTVQELMAQLFDIALKLGLDVV